MFFDWEDLQFFGLLILAFVLIFGVIFGLLAGLVAITDHFVCNQYQSMMPNHTFNWEFWTGCRILLSDGTYADASEWLNSHRIELDQ